MINLQIEIFLLLAIGYILSKIGLFTKSTRKQVTDIVLYVVLPAAIIQSFQMDMTKEILISTLAVLIISTCTMFLYLTFNFILYRKFEENKKINLSYATMVSNAGFMGMPIAEGAFGSVGLLYASIFLIPQRILMWSYGLSLYSTDKENVVKKVLTHPCIVAFYFGIPLMILRMNGIYLPTAISDTISAVAKCNTALSMFVIGGILSDVPFREFFDKTAIFYSIVRLLVLPLTIMGVLHFIPVNALAANVCVLESAMPAASTTAMLAQKYDRNPAFASKLVFVSTLLSLVTLPIITMLF